MWIMPDGGVVTVIDSEVVPLGDAQTYAQLAYEHSGNGLRIRYALKIRDGIARCAHIDLDDDNIRTRRVRPHLAIAACSQIVVMSNSIRVGSSPEKRAQAEQAAARRRDQEHRPEATAKICVDHGKVWGRTAAVAKAFHVSKRQAARYIHDAKDAGYIEEEK
jgi:hypothetical protein